MTDGSGPPPGTADKSLGEIVTEVSEKASLLVREEIELAKAEVTQKVTRLGKGAVIAVAGGVFVLFGSIYLFFGLAFLINDAFDWEQVWQGFMVITLALFLLGALAALIAFRLFKRGAPPTPELAIKEAKKTREAIEEARHG